MRRVILSIAASLDGYIATRDGGMTWIDSYSTEDYGFEHFLEQVGALVMGHKTYEFCNALPEWPYPKHPTLVLTHHYPPLHRSADVRFRSDGIEAIIEEAKIAAGEKDVWLVGGGQILEQTMKKGLLDEAIIFEMPLKLEDGIPLFPDPELAKTLRPISQKEYSNGVMEHHLVPSESA